MLLKLAFILSIAVAMLSSCSTTDSYAARQRPYVPRVAMPDIHELNANERAYLADVQDALGDAGYRCVHGAAEFRLDFVMEDGPVNADTHMTLYRGDTVLAKSFARVGGPQIILRRAAVVRQSFDKCLADFESKIQRGGYYGGPAGGAGGMGGYYGNQPSGAYSGGYSSYPQTGSGAQAPDWQTGWEN